MAIFKIKNLNFKYPKANKLSLQNINLDVKRGEFIVLMGSSGSGKSTLLRNLKPALAPAGTLDGEILFRHKEKSSAIPLNEVPQRIQASGIGYVLQNPDNQIVTDMVWHELAFGLENLGYEKQVIRTRVSEMANFFGMQTWFDRETKDLSGGQKQILNLASVMAMKPEVLILDEPTSMLDPITASEFTQLVRKINLEIGTTIILSEHRLDEVLSIADRTVVLENGRIIANDTPANVGAILANDNNNIFVAMPSPMQAYIKLYNQGYGTNLDCPIDVKGGRLWLNEILDGVNLEHTEVITINPDKTSRGNTTPVFQLRDVWFRYTKESKDILKGLCLNIDEGEILALVGGNGCGKSTTLNVLAGIKRAFSGSVKLYGKKIEKYNDGELRRGLLGMLPQDPQSIFVTDRVMDDLIEVVKGRNLSDTEAISELERVIELTEIQSLLESHPYDISGGEQQRVALAKVLLLDPKIILLDEPTKGIDNFFKEKFGNILCKLKNESKTIIMVSHDVEFCGIFADRCAMVFDGKIASESNANSFFSGNSFYTTSANKMSSHLYNNAITAQNVADLTLANLESNQGRKGLDDCRDKEDGDGGNVEDSDDDSNSIDDDVRGDGNDSIDGVDSNSNGESADAPLDNEDKSNILKKNSTDNVIYDEGIKQIKQKKSIRKRLVISLLAIATLTGLAFASINIGSGSSYYMFITIIIVAMIVPFFINFEKKRSQARELVMMSVIIALAVAGRAAFFMVPQVKPVIAIVIAGSFCLGPSSGFIIGAMTAFVSNFLFGQGPWTPFQMIGMGMVGLLTGLIGEKVRAKWSSRDSAEGINNNKATDDAEQNIALKRTRNNLPVWFLCVCGIITFFVYGFFSDFWTIFVMGQFSLEGMLLVYGAAVPFNLILAAATVLFLKIFGGAMVSKIERIKTKYGFAS